ncbi:MAG: molybdate ABC transporter substrate-binding protein [Firmicutes bacterium]|nr:molybdate ABC transporter substrate-binding protein [Bacillota bacterium]
MILKGRKINWIATAVIFLLLFTGCSNSSGDKATVKDPASANPKATLFAYVGAGLKDPVTELAQTYEQRTGIKVEMTFNNSGALLSQLGTSKKGDVYMPGGMPFVQQAKQAGHVTDIVGPIAYHVPVIITPKGNPAKITKVQDLAKPGTKVVLPDKGATAIGQMAFKTFDKLGITKDVEKNVLAYVETAPKVITAITMGQGDVSIGEYSAVVNNKDKLEMIEIDPAVNEIEQIPCALVTYSTQKEETQKFIDFVAKEGPGVFAKYGFKTRL